MEKALEKMKKIDNITDNIVNNLALLTQEGVISFEDAQKIIRSISNKQSNWMKSTFTYSEVCEFMGDNIL